MNIHKATKVAVVSLMTVIVMLVWVTFAFAQPKKSAFPYEKLKEAAIASVIKEIKEDVPNATELKVTVIGYFEERADEIEMYLKAEYAHATLELGGRRKGGRWVRKSTREFIRLKSVTGPKWILRKNDWFEVVK